MSAVNLFVRVLWLAIVLFVGFLGMPDAARPADQTAYRLGSGDRVRVEVYNEPDLSGDFIVNGQGTIALPLVGQLSVDGKTIDEAEAIITEKYAAKYLVNPRVTIEVLNYRPFFIVGEVKNPGGYPFMAGMTVLNAVAVAGGYTYRADKDDIVIKRGNEPSAQEKRVRENDSVLPGDIIRVKERYF